MVSTSRNSLNACSKVQSLFLSCRPRGRLVAPPPAPCGTKPGGALTMKLSSFALLAAWTLPEWLVGAPGAEVSNTNTPAQAKRDPVSCQTVRFSDVGWTDVTATTALVT